MQIIMVTNVMAPDKLGGLERYVRELSAQLVADGHRVASISKKTSSEQPTNEVGSDGVEMFRYSPPTKRDPLFAAKYPFAIARGVSRALASFAGSQGAGSETVVHGHFPVPMLPVMAQRTPYIYTFHAPVHKELLGERQGSYALPGPMRAMSVAGLRALEKRVLMSARAVTTLSTFTRSEMLSLTGGRGPKHHLIPGGLDTTYFSPGSSSGPPRTIPPGPILVTARRLVERTGVENLVAAMPAIIARYPSTQLVIMGDGPRRTAIEEYVQSAGLRGNVHMLGRVSDDELLAWYQSADLAVTPTYELEGFGLATAEALSCGLPTLVTPVGANPEVVADLGPAFVSGTHRSEDIAQSVIALLADRAALDSARERARSLVHPSMGWERISQEFVEVYRSAGYRSTGL